MVQNMDLPDCVCTLVFDVSRHEWVAPHSAAQHWKRWLTVGGVSDKSASLLNGSWGFGQRWKEMRLIGFSAGRCPARRIDLRPVPFLAKRGLAASRCANSHLPRPSPSLLAPFCSAFARFLFSAQRRQTKTYSLNFVGLVVGQIVWMRRGE